MIRKFILPMYFIAIGLHIGFCNPANAHSDVFFAAAGGQVAVGGANELGTIEENYDLTTRVFEGVMFSNFPPFSPADYGRDEPGLVALPSDSSALPVGATALPANTAMTLNLPAFSIGGNTDSMFYWNGVGAVNFQPISTAQPGVGLTIDPSPIGATSANGSMHEHAAFMIDNGGAGVPADGVYLIAPTASVAGLSDSDRFYMVWLIDALFDDEDAAEGLEESLEMGETVYLGKDFAFFENAVDYVQDQVVPEPATALLAIVAGAGFVANIRTRREC